MVLFGLGVGYDSVLLCWMGFGSWGWAVFVWWWFEFVVLLLFVVVWFGRFACWFVLVVVVAGLLPLCSG